jgi:hypothetical protein
VSPTAGLAERRHQRSHVTSRAPAAVTVPPLHLLASRPQEDAGPIRFCSSPRRPDSRFLTRRGTGTATPVLFTRARDADADAHRPCLPLPGPVHCPVSRHPPVPCPFVGWVASSLILGACCQS